MNKPTLRTVLVAAFYEPPRGRNAWLPQRPRLFALPGKKTDEQGRRWTVCQMRHVGNCEQPGAFTQDSVNYETSVQVYLPPNGLPVR